MMPPVEGNCSAWPALSSLVETSAFCPQLFIFSVNEVSEEIMLNSTFFNENPIYNSLRVEKKE